jgi:hypothetical protein
MRERGLGLFLLLIGCSACQHIAPPFPIGLYSVPPSDLAQVRAAGFNVVTGPATKAYLDSAERRGLKVLASPGTSAGARFDANRARQIVARFDSHPALWAWYLVDEPDLNGVSPTAVRQAHRFLKNVGALKPTALVLYQGGEALNFGNIADLTLVDRYPIPWLPLANFPQHVRMARLALGKGKPLLAVVQAFDWTAYPRERPSEVAMRPPTLLEIRCMTYCALARGATGIFYYCFNDGAWKLTAHPETWESVRKVVAEIHQRLPLFEGEPLWWPYVHEFPNSESGFNAALETSVIPTLLRVKHGNVAVKPGDYLLAVNNTEKQLTYRITLPRSRASIAVLGEGRSVPVEKGWLEDQFGPYAVHVYGPIL